MKKEPGDSVWRGLICPPDMDKGPVAISTGHGQSHPSVYKDLRGAPDGLSASSCSTTISTLLPGLFSQHRKSYLFTRAELA